MQNRLIILGGLKPHSVYRTRDVGYIDYATSRVIPGTDY